MKKRILPSVLTVVFSFSILTSVNQEVFANEQRVNQDKAEFNFYAVGLKAHDLEIDQDEKFDPFDKRIGLEATDKMAGDLTNKIEVIHNDVNSSVPGNYKVTYRVKNSRNEVAEKTIKVSVRINNTWPNGQASGWKMFSGHDVQLQHNPKEALIGDYTFYSDSHSSIYKHFTENDGLKKGTEYRVTIYVKPVNGKPESNRVKVSLKEDPAGKDSRELLNTFASKEQLAEKGYYRVTKTFKVGENETNPLIVVENFSAGYIGSINISKTVEPPKQAAPITIKYVEHEWWNFPNGTELATSDTITGNIGETYETKPKFIQGYRVDKKTQNTSGVFTTEPQTVTYAYTRVAYDVRNFAEKEADRMSNQLIGKDIEKALAKQQKKLGYLIGDELKLEGVSTKWTRTIPESSSVQINDETRVYGSTEFAYFKANLSNSFNEITIKKTYNEDSSDRLAFAISTSYKYFVEQWDAQKEQWIKSSSAFTGPSFGNGILDFSGYYEIAPNLDLQIIKNEMDIQKDSSFNIKPEVFYKELSSAGGTRSKFVNIPDLSKLGQQTVQIRVWDQYVTQYGWDRVDGIEDSDWESGARPLNSKHYKTFDVTFNVVEKK
ncbi:MucBP domain-containing protein [Candidatus Enterococcus mansonii]|uniref:DUF5011 domain-containing protein n=2 Tax=Candidatus Enterococcus mansonii TaxID=1834181 RepID=A0ABU8IIS2_9ENTE